MLLIIIVGILLQQIKAFYFFLLRYFSMNINDKQKNKEKSLCKKKITFLMETHSSNHNFQNKND